MKRLILYFTTLASTLICTVEGSSNCDLRIYGEFLYLTSCTDAFFFAVDKQGSNDVTIDESTILSSDFTRKGKVPDGNGQAAYRLGIAASFLCSEWSFGADYWHYNTSSSSSLSSPEDAPLPTLAPFTGHTLNTDSFSYSLNDVIISSLRAKELCGEWKLKIDAARFQIGNVFQITCDLKTHPYLDIKFLRVDHDVCLTHEGVITNPGSFNSFFITNVIPSDLRYEGAILADYIALEDISIEFQGLGPSFGIGIQYEICSNFGIYTDLSTSMLYGKREISDDAFLDRIEIFAENVESANGLTLCEKRKGNNWCQRVIFDTSVGLYSTWCCSDCLTLEAKVGWELHYFFNLGLGNFDVPFQGWVSREANDLTVQGLTLSLGAHF